MFGQHESQSYLLVNWVYFCVGEIPEYIKRRQRDQKDIEIRNLEPFKGKFTSDMDIDQFEDKNKISRLEDDTTNNKKKLVLVAPNQQTLKIAFTLMRDWCPSSAYNLELKFDPNGLIPLIEEPKRKCRK